MATPKKQPSPFADKPAAAATAARPLPQRVPLQPEASAMAVEETPSANALPARTEAEVTLDEKAHAPEFNGMPVTRRSRKSFSVRDARLAYPVREGFHRHWFNDVRDRLARAQEAGYAFVKDAKGQNVAKPGGYYDGNAIKIYLMELPMSWRNDDLEARSEKSDELDQQVVQGKYKEEAGDNRYVPDAGINIRTVRGPGRG